VQPQAPEQQPRQGGEHGTVSPVRPGKYDLPTQDSDLVPQHEDLRILRHYAWSDSEPHSRVSKLPLASGRVRRFFRRRQMVMTTFPRACPCSRYRMALGPSLSG
jgi:hypothetical protein